MKNVIKNKIFIPQNVTNFSSVDNFWTIYSQIRVLQSTSNNGVPKCTSNIVQSSP